MTIDAASLEPGERLLWNGTPNAAWFSARNFETSSWIGRALLFIAAVIATFQYMANSSTSEAGAIPAALAIIGAFFASRPFWVGRDLRRMRYALTSHRAIIERPGLLLRNRDSVPYTEIVRIEVPRQSYSDVLIYGDVIFRDFYVDTENGRQNTRGGFIAIADFAKVGQLLRTQVEEAYGVPLLYTGPDTWSVGRHAADG